MAEVRALVAALACVIGGMDVVRPLGVEGIDSAVVGRPGAPQWYSRFTRARIDIAGIRDHPEELVERLVRFGSAQAEPPVLFFDQDGYVQFVSRNREPLGSAFRFTLPDAALVDDLVDKARFHVLAERLALPVPATRHVHPADAPTDLGLAYPIVIKPLTRSDRDRPWVAIGGTAKAVRVDTPAAADALWPRLAATGVDYLAQELIPGPESRMESHHLYVDPEGTIVAEFTGREVRTYPTEFGHSTAVVTTDAPDVRALGRDIVVRLGLTGVAKLDFKRAPDGRLVLIEVNPRFSFWSNPGARAGVNLPVLVYRDLVGLPRARIGPARPGVSWCDPLPDSKAVRASGGSRGRWVAGVVRSDTRAELAWDDPGPFLRGRVWNRRRLVIRSVARAAVRRLHPEPAAKGSS